MFVPLSPAGIPLTLTLSHGGERGLLNSRRLLMAGLNSLRNPSVSPLGKGRVSLD